MRMGKYSGKKCRLISMFALTGSFFLVEIIVGYLTNSMALVADSFHMLSDVAALIIAFISVKMAPKNWNRNTYGWARAEVLGALVNAVFLVALCFSITVESLKRFYKMEEIENPKLILIVGSSGLIVNLLGLCLFHKHGSHLSDLADSDEKEELDSSISHGHSHGGGGAHMNMRGVFLHLLSDALGSVIVIISALIMWLTNWEYKNLIDPILSLVLVLIIMISVWPLLLVSALILLQTVPSHLNADKIKIKLLESIEEILAIHDFHIWQLTGNRIIASAHIRCFNVQEYMRVAEKVKEFFHLEGIHSTTIQPEFIALPKGDIEDCAINCPPATTLIKIPNCQKSKCCYTNMSSSHSTELSTLSLNESSK